MTTANRPTAPARPVNRAFARHTPVGQTPARKESRPAPRIRNASEIPVLAEEMARTPLLSREEHDAVMAAVCTAKAAAWQAALGGPLPAVNADILRDAAAAILDDYSSKTTADTALLARVVAADGDWNELRSAQAAALAAAEVHGRTAKHRKACDDWRTRVLATRATLAHHVDRAVRANLRLVTHLAGKERARGRTTLDLADLIQHGNVGLLCAIRRFDPSRGFRLATYATWWIRHHITRGDADEGRAIRYPIGFQDAAARIRRAISVFSNEHGRKPTVEEIVALSGVAKARIESILKEPTHGRPVLSMDTAFRVNGGNASDFEVSFQDILPDDAPTPEEATLTTTEALALREAVAALDPTQADILSRRFGLGPAGTLDECPEETLAEIGDRYDLSRERIRQVQNEALDNLRRAVVRRRRTPRGVHNVL